MDKLPESEYENIIKEILKRRLEYFANTTSKCCDEVLERDGHRCLSCRTDGIKPYARKNGKTMKNPLIIR